ncbi:endonuclease/exonuclease/phosphatase family protein [Vibrio diabolicus]|uniref:endonuclease/exonuclease/phosphatase family protein n=1 Tax=Vibrio diabolicus TaxID=50719 RepID=UPI0018F8C7D5|nr:endonuclease/exonuclease/phosphatase family protein [Vibrio diabolicus]NTU37945.1 endonuclease/exonuclease/phosphatase family protein [Vibrio diabolicus]
MSQPSRITFVTANLFNFVAPPDAYYDFENIYSLEQWQDKLAWTQRQVEKLEGDVIGLQEVFSIEKTQAFFSTIGYPYFATVDTPHVEDEYIYSSPVVAIASRFPIEKVQAVEFDLATLEPFGVNIAPEFSRKPIYAQVIHPVLGHIAVYVTHLKSQRPADSEQPETSSTIIGRWLSTQQRGWEAAMLRVAMQKRYRKEPMPTVLMGDMNQPITPTSVNSALVSNAGDSVTELQLKDGWSLQSDALKDERPATHYHFSTGNVLDYILLSQEFDTLSDISVAEVVDYQVSNQHLINPIYDRDKNASDHAFVALTAEVKL